MKENKYFTLYQTIKERILRGEYPAGSKLPSKRVMADRMGYSVMTVETAYNLLAEEGYLVPRERSGYFVSTLDLPAPTKKSITPSLSYLPEDTGHSAGSLLGSAWFKTVRKVIGEQGNRLFVKSPGKGLPALRNALAAYLLRYRGMVAQPEQIIIGSGAEQLYETVIQLLGRERVYGIENPSYVQIESVYRAEGARVEKLKMGNEGIDSSALLKTSASVLHVTPFGSYPSGVTATAGKRFEYLAWAKPDRYLVEDDFGSEFFAPGQPLETLFAMSGGDRVLYLNTFSKTLSPAMRMGYLILPKQLMEDYDRKLGQFSCSVPVLDQYVLAEFLNAGHFERHLSRLRRRMKK